MRITILAFNAHPNCAEGTARILFNLYAALRRVNLEAKLISLIDTKFEETFLLKYFSKDNLKHEHYIVLNTDRLNNEIKKVIKDPLLKDSDFIINGLFGIKSKAYLRFHKIFTLQKWKIIENLFSRPFKFIEKCKYVMPLTSKIFVYSPSEYRYLCKTLPIISHKISLIPPPVNTDLFIKRDRGRSLRMFGLDEFEDKLLIGYVGNPFVDRFPVIKVFKALAEVAPKHDAMFVGVFPPYRGRTSSDVIYRIAKFFNIEKRVLIFEKFIDYYCKPFLYSSFDVLLHLYKWREAPYPFLTVLEAFSVGTPVITTNYNEILWVTKNIDYPLFIDLAGGINALSIKNALEVYINQKNTEKIDSTLSLIRSRIVKTFSLESVGRRVLIELRRYNS